MALGEQTTQSAPAPILDYAAGSGRTSKWGKGFLAVAGTLVHPGLGHLLVGRFRRAVFWAALAAVLEAAALIAMTQPRGYPVCVGFGLLAVLTTLVTLVDAFLCGRASQGRLLGKPWRRYVVSIGLIMASVLLSPLSLSSLSIPHNLTQRYARAFAISFSSMAPTLVPGDRIIVHKEAARNRWSLVVFEHPQYGAETVIVGRVVGLPGETVEIVGGQLKINGTVITPPQGVGPWTSVSYRTRMNMALYGRPGVGCEGNPIVLTEDEYFVLGDNSPMALDARLWEVACAGHQLGALPARQIRGRVTWLYWPPGRWRYFD